VIRARQHLTLGVHAHLHADRRDARAREALGPLGGVEGRPTPAGARLMVSSGAGLREPVDLDELPAELRLDPLDRLGRRRCAGDHHPHAALARHRHALGPARGRGIERSGDDGGAQLRMVTPSLSIRLRISSPSILRMMT
jgi:hypothetical protein